MCCGTDICISSKAVFAVFDLLVVTCQEKVMQLDAEVMQEVIYQAILGKAEVVAQVRFRP